MHVQLLFPVPKTSANVGVRGNAATNKPVTLMQQAYLYIYIYICLCVCVCVRAKVSIPMMLKLRFNDPMSHHYCTP